MIAAVPHQGGATWAVLQYLLGFRRLGHAMRFGGPTHFLTVGLALGRPECPVPTLGLPWIATPQPVMLERWPVAQCIADDALTTVANWRGYGSVEHDGVFYGQKVHAL